MRRLLVLTLLLSVAFPATADAARLWSSGCELQASGNMTDNLEWDTGGTDVGSTQIITATTRSGLSACGVVRASDGYGQFEQQFSAADSANSFYFRFYLYISATPDENAAIACVGGTDACSGGTGEQMIVLNTDRTLRLINDASTGDVDTDTTVLSTGTWYRIEWNYDSGGATEVRVDGVQVLQAGSHDGDSITHFMLGMCAGFTQQASNCGPDGAATGTLYFEDVALNDTSGGSQTSWPGAGSIVHMQPNANGDNNGCSLDSTTGDYSDVAEVTPDDSSTHCDLDNVSDIVDVNVESSSNAGIDSYDTVTLVQVGIRDRAETGAAESWTLRLKSASGGTVAGSVSVSHDDVTFRTNGDAAPRNYKLTSYTDPTTSVAWTPTGTNSLDNMQIGIESVDADPDIWVTTLWGLVEYVDGVEPAAAARISGLRLGAFGSLKITGGGIIIR